MDNIIILHLQHSYYYIKRSPLSHCKCSTFRLFIELLASVIVCMVVVISDVERAGWAEHAVDKGGSSEVSASSHSITPGAVKTMSTNGNALKGNDKPCSTSTLWSHALLTTIKNIKGRLWLGLLVLCEVVLFADRRLCQSTMLHK